MIIKTGIVWFIRPHSDDVIMHNHCVFQLAVITDKLGAMLTPGSSETTNFYSWIGGGVLECIVKFGEGLLGGHSF